MKLNDIDLPTLCIKNVVTSKPIVCHNTVQLKFHGRFGLLNPGQFFT